MAFQVSAPYEIATDVNGRRTFRRASAITAATAVEFASLATIDTASLAGRTDEPGDELHNAADGRTYKLRVGGDPKVAADWIVDAVKPRKYTDEAARIARTGFTPIAGELFMVGDLQWRAHETTPATAATDTPLAGNLRVNSQAIATTTSVPKDATIQIGTGANYLATYLNISGGALPATAVNLADHTRFAPLHRWRGGTLRANAAIPTPEDSNLYYSDWTVGALPTPVRIRSHLYVGVIQATEAAFTAMTDVQRAAVKVIWTYYDSVANQAGNGFLYVASRPPAPDVGQRLTMLTVTAAYAANEVIDLTNGNGTATGRATIPPTGFGSSPVEASPSLNNIRTSAATFIVDHSVFVELDGTPLVKGVDVIWDSPTTLHLTQALVPGDTLLIYVTNWAQ